MKSIFSGIAGIFLQALISCSSIPPRFTSKLERQLNLAGHVFEWADIKQDLKVLQQVTIEEGRQRHVAYNLGNFIQHVRGKPF
ncbi:MAG: hypothetical protein R6V60_19740 [Desulfobacterales bacterium]